MQAEEYLSRTEILHASLAATLSRFHHLTESNMPPNHCETSELRALISESRSQLSDDTNVLAEIEKITKSVMIRVDQVACVYESAKKIIHPLRALPNEILSLIFAQCVDYEDRARNSLSVAQAPWTLSHVCRRWRRLVTNYPSLWTTPCFDFTVHGTDRRLQQHTLYLLVLYLERSRALPLDVTLRVMRNRAGHDSLRHVLEATTERWRSVVLDLSLREILLFKRCSLPLLKSVDIRDCRRDYDYEHEDVELFSSVPLLDSLTVSSKYLQIFQSFPFPWSQIVKYNCEHTMFYSVNSNVLKQMTALRYLTANIVVGAALFDATEPLVLPSLTQLKLSVAGGTDLGGIHLSSYLAYLRMSLLNDLTLSFCQSPALCPLSSHPNFLSVKTLRVHLNLASIESGNIVHFLSFMGGVEELELSGVNIADDLLQALTPTDDGTLVVPRLRVLDTHNCGGAPHMLAFHNMLLSRSHAHERLTVTLEKFVAPSTWRIGNHQAVVPLSEEVSMRWERVCAAISVSYIDPDEMIGVQEPEESGSFIEEDSDAGDSD